MANQYTAFRFVSDTLKECSLCGEIKPHKDFSKDKRNLRAYGLAYYCKTCASNKSRSYHKQNCTSLEFKLNKKNSYIKNKHNISLEDYNNKLQAQNYSCAICSITLPKHGTKTHLDHNHVTGKLRDFLCTNCNRGLGHFQDSKELLILAALYLDKHNESL